MLHGTLLRTPTAPDLGQEPPEWTLEAVCLSVDPELFFPEKGIPARAARAVCRGCPVIAECLDYALRNGEAFGVWGGTTERERRGMERGRKQPAPLIPTVCPSCGDTFVSLGGHQVKSAACRTTQPGAA